MAEKTKFLRDLVQDHKYLKVSPTDLISNVACLMPAHHTSAAAVMSEDEKLIGIITEQDIVEKAVGVYRNVDETKVEDIMTPDPVTISIDAPLNEALKLLTQHGFRTLPVMDGKKVAGIVDIRDLYEALRIMLEEEIKFKEGLMAYAYGDTYGGGYRKAG